MKPYFKLSLFLVFILIIACSNNDDSDPIDSDDVISPTTNLEIVNAFPSLRFNRPVDLQSPDDGTNRIFVVEQSGVISVFPNDSSTTDRSTFLNIEAIVDDSDNEMGLLGLAFHPNYSNNGFFYINYSVSRSLSRISQFQVSSTNSNQADISSELVLINIPQPFTNHNGGKLVFGPNDGLLYIASGDGGSGGDPQGNAQNRSNLLGSILRVNVDRTENGLNYGIPPDNPFAGSSILSQEIYAYGLRNPWRISFDIDTGMLWAGDVGQNEIEEINIIENGNNYGWNILEGSDCFNANACNQTGLTLTLPVFEYSHDNGDLSITGGYVYRGTQVPQLIGRYVYGDFVSGRIWSLDAESDNRDNQLIGDTNFNIASFGTDINNELYICAFDGHIYKFANN